MAEDWFAQHAPKTSSAPPTGGDWFKANAPKPLPGMERLGTLPAAGSNPVRTGETVPDELSGKDEQRINDAMNPAHMLRLGGRGLPPDLFTGNAIRGNVNQVGRGTAALAGDDPKGGAADILEGAAGAVGNVTKPLIAPAAAAAPLATAGAIVGATGAAKTAELVTQLFKGDEDDKRIASVIAGALGGGAGGKLGSVISRILSGLTGGGSVSSAVKAISEIPNKGEVLAQMAEKVPIVKAVTPLLEATSTTYTPPAPGGTGGIRTVPKGKVTPVQYGTGAGHFGEDIPPPAIPQAPPPRVPIWQRPDGAAVSTLADVAEAEQLPSIDPQQIMRDRLAARSRPAPIAPRAQRPDPAWLQGPGPSDVSRGTTVADLTQLDPVAVQQMAQQRMAENLAARRRESSGVNRILALRDEAPGAASPETPVAPAPSPEASIGATEAPIKSETLADVEKADPITAIRNKQREEKFGKVIDHLLKEGYPEVGMKPATVTPENLAKVRGISDRQWSAVAQRAGVADLTKPQRAEVLKRLAVPNETPAASPAAAQPATVAAQEVPNGQLQTQPTGGGSQGGTPPLETPAVSGARSPASGGNSEIGSEAGRGPSDTEVYIPGEDRTYRAKYRLAELSDVQASHNGQTFQPNPKYGLSNDRDYTQPENQGKIVEGSLASKFRPSLLITDNPDASNGPPLLDFKGNAVGGNGRTMILHRVYGENGDAAARYRYTLKQKAAQYGVDPAMVDQMKQPVLVRQMSADELGGDAGAQAAVTDFNKTGTAALRAPERMIADSRKVSPATLDHIAEKMEAIGPDATLAEALNGDAGLEVFHRMVKDGVVTPQETAAYVSGGKLTPEGVQRLSKLMLARFFKDPAQLDAMSSLTKSKIEKMAAPLVKAEVSPEWNLTPTLQDAMFLFEDMKARGSKNIDVAVKQDNIGRAAYSPQAVTLAKMLKTAKANDMKTAARAYADMAITAAREAEQPSMFGGSALSPSEAFQKTFGQIAPAAKRAKPTGKTVADLAQ